METSTEISIAAVVVTYNRMETLKRCVSALQAQTGYVPDILLIDNASTDGTALFCRTLAENNNKIHYYNTGSNLGGAGGFSFGIKTGVLEGYNYLWLMDDDTIPEDNALEMLLQAAEKLDGKFGFLSSYAVWKDGSACKMNVPGPSNCWKEEVDNQFENKIFRIDYASFVSMLIKSDVVRDVGLPIKEFFIWSDDIEYTTRISKKYPCYFVYESRVLHAMQTNASTNILNEKSDRLERYRYLYRNRYYIAKNGYKRDFILFQILTMNTIRDLMKSESRDKLRRMKIVIQSYLSGIRFHPQIEYVNEEREKK